ncbi:MAG: DUF4136 domain-containing protein [Acidobacteria bacterium]|nr:DUF4136 domain-containing protein [Acidobacteriota bacterium]
MKRLLALAIAGLVVSACSSVSTSLDYNPDVDFAKYRKYEWIPTEGRAADNFAHLRIVSAVDRIMAARGMTKVQEGGDLAVGYQATTDERSTYTTVSAGWGGYGWGGGWYRGGMGMGTSTTTENRYQVGTVIIGMFDGSDKELVWTGQASDTIRPNLTPGERQAHVDEVLGDLMRDFPPGS